MNLKIALAISAVVSAIDQRTFEFMRYISSHGKRYETLAEFEMRKDIFFANDAIIKEWNADESNTSRMGHNFLSDWTEAEFEAILTYQENMHTDTIVEVEPSSNAVPIDWRTLGAVQAIKDQGSCGSCWSFSAVSAVESAWEIAHGTLFSLSEQQLVDCHVCDGCNGGSSETAFVYYETHFAMTESSYPYKAVQGATCQYNINDNAGVETTGYSRTTAGDINQMQSVLAQQPISISIYANSNFQRYTSGIFNDTTCPTQSHNHAVNWIYLTYDCRFNNCLIALTTGYQLCAIFNCLRNCAFYPNCFTFGN